MTDDPPGAKRAPPSGDKRQRRLSQATKDEARRLFEVVGLGKAEISRRLHISRETVLRLARGSGWRRGAGRTALVAKIRTRVEAEIAQVSRVLDQGGASPEAAERSARTLASLARTLRELSKVDEDRARASGRDDRAGDQDPDDDLADLDGFRAALAERLDRLRREREA